MWLGCLRRTPDLNSERLLQRSKVRHYNSSLLAAAMSPSLVANPYLVLHMFQIVSSVRAPFLVREGSLVMLRLFSLVPSFVKSLAWAKRLMVSETSTRKGKSEERNRHHDVLGMRVKGRRNGRRFHKTQAANHRGRIVRRIDMIPYMEVFLKPKHWHGSCL